MGKNYKVLLVDDEKLTTMSIEKQIRVENCGFEVAGTAANGEEALRILEETGADIVLADIRMPRMDGIEFMNRIQEKGIETKVIVLSAYRDFEYAKQALCFGAKDYLLKPLSKERLFQALQNVAEMLDQERQVKRERLLEEQKVALRALLEKGQKTSGLPSAFDSPEQTGICLMACQESFPKPFEEDCMDLGWYPLRDTQMVVPFLWENGRESLKRLVEDTRNMQEEYMLTDVVITVSGKILPEDGFQNAYNECKIANMYYFYLSHQDVICYSEVEHFGKSSMMKAVKLFEEVKECFMLGTEEEIQGKLTELYQGLSQEMCINAETVYQLFTDQLLSLYRIKISGEDVKRKAEEVGKRLRRFTTLETLFSWVKSEISRCLAVEDENAQESDDRLIARVKAYCRENYSKDCSLDDIAAHMYMSKSYLSQLFKEKTGLSIWNYFTDIRMETAKAMLAGGTIKAIEVSRLVGYKNPSHFGRIFKERVGVSPKEYQQTVCL